MQMRRRELLAAGMVTLGGCQSVDRSSSGVRGAESWGQSNRTAAHRGIAPAGELPSDRPPTRQRVSLTGPVVTSPVGTDRMIAVGEAGSVRFVTRERLGTTRVEVGERQPRTPVVRDERLYATAVEPGEPALMIAARRDGTVVWRRSLASDDATAPTVTDGTVYVSTRAAHAAFDAATGDRRWATRDERWTAGDSEPGRLTTDNLAPAVGADRVVVPTAEGIAALDRTDGTPRWRQPVGRVVSAPTVADGAVYVPSVDRGLIAVDLGSGDRLWRWDATPCWATPAVTDDRVYAAAGMTPAALDRSGDPVWRGDSLGGAVSTGVAVVGDTVVTASHTIALAAVDADSGAENWRIADGNGSFHAPIAVGDRIAAVQYTNDGPVLRLFGSRRA